MPSGTAALQPTTVSYYGLESCRGVRTPVLAVLQAAGRTASLLLSDRHFTMHKLQLLWGHGDEANPVAAKS